MRAEKLLAEAAAVVRNRRHTYGKPLDLFERVAIRWSQILGTSVTPAQGHCVPDRPEGRQVDPRSTALRQHHRHRGLLGLLGGGAFRCVSCVATGGIADEQANQAE
jgi:hypothetical protein